ncbi:hypothetical protein NKJ19_24450 [Mesorhizobium sp. M0203]
MERVAQAAPLNRWPTTTGKKHVAARSSILATISMLAPMMLNTWAR